MIVPGHGKEPDEVESIRRDFVDRGAKRRQALVNREHRQLDLQRGDTIHALRSPAENVEIRALCIDLQQSGIAGKDLRCVIDHRVQPLHHDGLVLDVGCDHRKEALAEIAQRQQ